MKKSTKIAIAFLALAGAAGSVAWAADNHARKGERFGNRQGMAFGMADADSSGDVTFEEFAAVMNKRVASADGDGDGKMTVAEIAAEIQRMRAERMAQRIVERFDADGDGMLTAAEIEQRQKKMFALMDRNDDGKIVKDEMPRRWQHRRH